jgi:hypothetical protein
MSSDVFRCRSDVVGLPTKILTLTTPNLSQVGFSFRNLETFLPLRLFFLPASDVRLRFYFGSIEKDHVKEWAAHLFAPPLSILCRVAAFFFLKIFLEGWLKKNSLCCLRMTKFGMRSSGTVINTKGWWKMNVCLVLNSLRESQAVLTTAVGRCEGKPLCGFFFRLLSCGTPKTI